MGKDNKVMSYIANGKSENCIRKNPKFGQLMVIVDDAAELVMQGDDYNPLFLRPITEMKIIEAFTDIEIPRNSNDMYEFIQSSNIIEVLELHVMKEMEEIHDAVSKKVEYLKQQRYNTSKMDELLDEIITIVKNMGSKFDGVNMEDLTGLTSVAEKISGMDDETVISTIFELLDKKEKVNI